MIIRNAEPGDLEELQQLFVGTVSNVCKRDYNSEQLHVWLSGVENTARWHTVLTDQLVLVAVYQGKITGFCTLDKGQYIDLLYIHQDHQRQGIARLLFAEIEKEAKRLRQTELTAAVSITAKPFFDKMGFRVLKEQMVYVQRVGLTNFLMVKEI